MKTFTLATVGVVTAKLGVMAGRRSSIAKDRERLQAKNAARLKAAKLRHFPGQPTM